MCSFELFCFHSFSIYFKQHLFGYPFIENYYPHTKFNIFIYLFKLHTVFKQQNSCLGFIATTCILIFFYLEPIFPFSILYFLQYCLWCLQSLGFNVSWENVGSKSGYIFLEFLGSFVSFLYLSFLHFNMFFNTSWF